MGIGSSAPGPTAVSRVYWRCTVIATPGKLAQGVPREGPRDGTQAGRAERGTPTARHCRDRHRQATGLRQGAAVVRDRRPQSGRPVHDATAYRARGQALALGQGRRRRVPGRSPILACPGSYGPGGHAVDSSHGVLTTDQFAAGCTARCPRSGRAAASGGGSLPSWPPPCCSGRLPAFSPSWLSSRT